MSNVKVVLNTTGVRQLLQSQEMKNICEEQAQKAVSRLGEGYEATSMTGKTRVNASVVATTRDAINENMKNNTVLKALRG